MNETTDWWVALLAAKTAEAQTYANHNFRSIEKREIFMSAFHWTMVNARPEIFAALDRG